MTSVKVANFYGGIPIKNHREQLENDPPHIVVGTPGRIKQVGLELRVYSPLRPEAPGRLPLEALLSPFCVGAAVSTC